MTLAVEDYTPIFNTNLIQQFRHSIFAIIKSNVNSYDSPDVSYYFEDIYQECLGHLFNATKIYNAKTGVPFAKFAQMHIRSRAKDFRKKVVNSNKRETAYIEDFQEDYFSENRSSEMDIRLMLEEALRKLDSIEKVIFIDHFVMGKTVKEVVKSREDLTHKLYYKYLPKVKEAYECLVS